MKDLEKQLKNFIETKDDSFLDDYDLRGCAFSMKTLKMLKDIKKSDSKEHKAVWLETMLNVFTIALKVRRMDAGPRRAKFIHDIVEAEIKIQRDEKPGDISCKSGCSNCCYQFIATSDDEAQLLKDYPTIGNRLEEYSKLEETAKNYHKKPCIFLNDKGSCNAYKDRPNACRLLLSQSDPELCKGDSKSEKILYYMHKAEVVAAGYSTGVKKLTSLPKAIMEARSGNSI